MVTPDASGPGRYIHLPPPARVDYRPGPSNDPWDGFPTREQMLARHDAAGPPDLSDLAAVIARLDQGHADEDPGLYWRHTVKLEGGRRQRLMDTDRDQPSTTDNPYWELVRHLPFVEHHLRDPAGAVDAEPLDHYYPQRLNLQRWFAWAIPSPGDLAWLLEILAGRPLLDMGAGGGYWAWQLAQSGVDVLAIDSVPPARNEYSDRSEPWHPVQHGTGADAADHPDRVLMLCWPPLEGDLDVEALTAYQGDTLVTVGQMGGMCGSEPGYALLNAGWVRYRRSAVHLSFSGFACGLSAWVRHCRLSDAPGEGS